MSIPALPFEVPSTLVDLFANYAAAHKELDPEGVIQQVATSDPRSLVALLQAISQKPATGNAALWQTKSIERLNQMSKSLPAIDQLTFEQLRNRLYNAAPLYEAAARGSLEEVLLFIGAGSEINQQNGPNKETALHAAARGGHLEVVKVLLGKKANINAQTQAGETALYLALQGENVAVARELINRGAHTSLRSGRDDETPLHVAIKKSLPELITLLLDKKADRNAMTKSGVSPLSLALEMGNELVVYELVQAGANINQRHGKNYETALHRAVRGGYLEIVRHFLGTKKADINAVTKDGKTAFQLAEEAGYLDIMVALQAAGAKTEIKPKAATFAPVSHFPDIPPAILYGYGMQNPAVNACFINATLQALRHAEPFYTFLMTLKADVKPVGSDALLSLITLPASQQATIWQEVAISLGLYPREKEACSFPVKTSIEERQSYLTLALSKLKLAQEQLETISSLLRSPVEMRAKMLRDLLILSLTSLFETIEGKGRRADLVEAETILTFRHMLCIAGFQARGIKTQEDAQELMIYLLDILKAPRFQTKTFIHHGLNIPVPPLEKQKDTPTCLLLQVSEAAEGTSIEQLITANEVSEEIERIAIENSEGIKARATAEELEAIKSLPAISSTKTIQAIALQASDLPAFLPVSLKRYEHKEGAIHKVSKNFPLSKIIRVPLNVDEARYAEYSISSVVVHDGSTPQSGHYRAYVLVKVDGKDVWVEFNDEKTIVHKDAVPVERDIAKSGYLFFYTRQ